MNPALWAVAWLLLALAVAGLIVIWRTVVAYRGLPPGRRRAPGAADRSPDGAQAGGTAMSLGYVEIEAGL